MKHPDYVSARTLRRRKGRAIRKARRESRHRFAAISQGILLATGAFAAVTAGIAALGHAALIATTRIRALKEAAAIHADAQPTHEPTDLPDDDVEMMGILSDKTERTADELQFFERHNIPVHRVIRCDFENSMVRGRAVLRAEIELVGPYDGALLLPRASLESTPVSRLVITEDVEPFAAAGAVPSECPDAAQHPLMERCACGYPPKVAGGQDVFVHCGDCGAWPTHAPWCLRLRDHADGGL